MHCDSKIPGVHRKKERVKQLFHLALFPLSAKLFLQFFLLSAIFTLCHTYFLVITVAFSVMRIREKNNDALLCLIDSVMNDNKQMDVCLHIDYNTK